MDDYRWEDGVLRGSGPYYTAATLVRFIQSGSATSLFEASIAAARHAEGQRSIAEDAYHLGALLESAWTGSASEAAGDKIRSFAQVTDETARSLTRNERNLQQQMESFELLKSSLEPLPESHEVERSFLDRFRDNPFNIKDALSVYDDYNEKVQRTIRLYDAYAEQTERNFETISYEYGELSEFNAEVKVDNSRSSGVEDWTPPDYEPPEGSTPEFPPDRGELSDLSDVPDVDSLDGATSAAGVMPSAGSAAGGPPLSGAGGAGALGAGALGAGTGAGGGAEAGLGAGRGTGAAPMGGGAAAASAAARGGPAGAGRGGMGGMGMMGGAGGQGQGGEDQEYKSKGWLQENDPESLFGLDEKTVPPVIGAD